ncbi:MAG TPA: hypothetical protein PK797_11040, partial [Burkholderiaceae bacterium]|nr:hypothetical protein [Burkholderiaceae bacterium]
MTSAMVLAVALAGCGGGATGSSAPAAEPAEQPPVAADLTPVVARDGGSVLPVQWQGGAFMQI